MEAGQQKYSDDQLLGLDCTERSPEQYLWIAGEDYFQIWSVRYQQVIKSFKGQNLAPHEIVMPKTIGPTSYGYARSYPGIVAGLSVADLLNPPATFTQTPSFPIECVTRVRSSVFFCNDNG
jgi:hypothetical protein